MGFSPAASAGPAASAVTVQKPAGESPLGLFDVLLGLVGGSSIEGSQFIPAPSGDQQTALNALLAALPDIPTTPSTPPAPAAPATTAGEGEGEAAPDLATLLGDLLDALSAAVPATTGEQPLPAPVENKLDVAIDALAKALGITLPESGGETADGSINTPTLPATLDPLAAMGASTAGTEAGPTALPAAPAVPATVAPATAAVPPAPPTGIDVAAAVGASSTLEGTAPKAVEAVPVPPAAVKLAERITTLAKTLEPAAPALAEKLAALAERLKVGEVDAEALAKLGLPTEMDAPDAEIEAAITRLLPPAPEAKPAAPAPFTTATLALPDFGTTTKVRPTTAAESRPDAPAAASKPAAEPAPADDDTKPLRNERTADTGTKAPAPNAAPQATAEPAASQPGSSPAVAHAAPHVAGVASADTRSVLAAYKAPAQQINIPQVALEIVRQVQAGNSRFQIRLDPPELGRIDVKLDVDATGNVNARLTVERSETLDLMQRDHRALERALAQAGLDSSKTNLEFSLRQNPFAHDERAFEGNRNGGNSSNQFAALFGGDEADAAPAVPPALAYRALAPAGGVNIFV